MTKPPRMWPLWLALFLGMMAISQHFNELHRQKGFNEGYRTAGNRCIKTLENIEQDTADLMKQVNKILER